MREIIFHGRGGQGVVTSAKIINSAIIEGGQYAQFLPSFGVERKGSPVHGYLRQDDKPIRINCQIYHTKTLVVYDESLLSLPATFQGIVEGTEILVNSFHTPKELREIYDLPMEIKKIHVVNATLIAEETIGVDIPNTVMLGAYAKVIKGLDWDTLKDLIENKFGSKNVSAANRGYEEVYSEEVIDE